MQNCCRPNSLQACTRRCTFCTNLGFTFIGSPSRLLPFHIHLALAQTLYRVRGISEFTQISTHSATCGIAAGGVVCRPIHDDAPFAPTQGLHFQALHPLSFLFICTLHWCKHLTMLKGATNLRKFPFTALCGIGADGEVCRPVLDSAPFFCTNPGFTFSGSPSP